MDRIEVRNVLLVRLFTKAKKQVIQLISELIMLNAKELELSITQRYYFAYGDSLYYSPIPRVAFYNTMEVELQDHLLKRFEMMYDMSMALEREEIIIKSYFTDVLNHSESISDVKRILPTEYTRKDYEFAKSERLSQTAKEYIQKIEASGKRKINETKLKKRTLANLVIKNLKV